MLIDILHLVTTKQTHYDSVWFTDFHFCRQRCWVNVFNMHMKKSVFFSRDSHEKTYYCVYIYFLYWSEYMYFRVNICICICIFECICICIVTKIVLYVKVIPISLFESDKLSWNLEAKISQKALALTFVYIWSKNVDHFKLMNYVTFLASIIAFSHYEFESQ